MKKNFLALGTCAFALALGLVACDDSTSANGSSGDENPAEVSSSSTKDFGSVEDLSSSAPSLSSSSTTIEDPSSSSSSVIASSSGTKQSSSSVIVSSSSSAPTEDLSSCSVASSSSAKSSSSVASSSSAKSSSSVVVVKGAMTDSRDGQVYKTVTIGTQTWMAENLNYEPGDVSGMGSYAWSGCHNNEADSCVKYGRLYTWSAAMNACPYGWHLPSNAEWSILYEAVGGASTAGISLKSTNGWYGNGNGKDVCGFSVLPAGFRSYDGFFLDQGDYAYFWSSTEFEYSSNRACSPYFHYGNDFVYWDNGYTDDAISVRCLRD